MNSPIYKPSSEKAPDLAAVYKGDKTIQLIEDVDTRCGFGSFKPLILQPFAKISVFVGCFSLAALTTSTLTAYVNSQVTTLERQFGFNSSQTGLIMAANDIGFLVCVLFVGYLATRTHIPRSLGLAAICFGLSGISCSLPHFMFGGMLNIDPTKVAPSSNTNDSQVESDNRAAVYGRLCDFTNGSISSRCLTSADKTGASSQLVDHEQVSTISLVIIVVGMALQGFGKAPRMSFTVTYVDDNTSRIKTGFYMGFITTLGILGPPTAFAMGGYFSNMYVTLQETKLTPKHPRWIGAWWLGYIVFGLLALVISVPLFCFPRKLARKSDKAKDVEKSSTNGVARSGEGYTPLSQVNKKETEVNNNKHSYQPDSKEKTSRGINFKPLLFHSREFLLSLYRLARNPIYTCVVISACFTIFTVSGTQSFTPKYMERMFNLPAYMVNYVIAMQTLLTSCVGTFVGGYLTRRLKMTAYTALRFNMCVLAVGTLAQTAGMIFQCDHPRVHNWPGETNNCTSQCDCEDNSYFPICGQDGKTYYSPCHAGCLEVTAGSYNNCSCIPGGQATSGTCDYRCSHLYAYSVIMGIRQLCGTLAIVPKLIIFIRCVSPQDKSMGLAVAPFMSALLGWLLAPIVFGNVIDSICTIWDIKCGVTGRCLLYDNDLFRLKLHGYGAICLFLSTLFVVIAFLYAKRTKCLDEPVREQEVEGDLITQAALIVNGDTNDQTADDNHDINHNKH